LATASIVTKPTFTLSDRMKIQEQMIRERRYKIIGRLTAVCFEGQRSTKGYSASRARFANAEQAKGLPESLVPFSEVQAKLWASVTLDWLTHKNAPILALSSDQQDLLLPGGMIPLPPIPDPRWTPKTAGEIAPRIPQLLTGCPVVGDRVRDKITDRSGKVYGVLHPIKELQIMLLGAIGTFARIRGCVDPSDGTHMALLIDDSNPEQLQGYFVGGRFQFGN
jgi:hypothetical protein